MGFQQGLSGLNASAKALDVIGNNIANTNTVGFKTGQTQFADVFAATLSGAGAAPFGLGTKVAAIVQQFTQGNITVTNNPLDTAINGNGFFQLDDGLGGTLYSRNGQFQLDQNGYIVNAQGLQLKGIVADNNGVIVTGAPPQPLRLFDPAQSLSGPPLMTGGSTSGTPGVRINVNLDSRLPNPTTPFTIDPVTRLADVNSYNSSTATTIYDSLGNAHTYTLYFAKVSGASLAAAVAISDMSLNATQAGVLGSAVADAFSAAISIGASQSDAEAGVAAALNSAVYDIHGGANITTAAANAAAAALAAAPGLTAAQADAIANVVARIPLAVASAAATATTPLDATIAASMVSAAATAPANTWNVYASVTNPAGATPTFTDLTGGNGVPGAATPVGTLQFNTSGVLTSSAFTETLLGAADVALGYPGAIDPGQTFPLDFTGSTQYGAPFAVNALTQDGYASGTLSGFNIGEDGVVLGRYTNGQSKAIGQVILATFRNPQGLQPLGNNVWALSPQSGPAITGAPGSSGQFGPLQSAALEDANVDLTAELVQMITQQRVYQANAQTIKTQDQILQTLVNMR